MLLCNACRLFGGGGGGGGGCLAPKQAPTMGFLMFGPQGDGQH